MAIKDTVKKFLTGISRKYSKTIGKLRFDISKEMMKFQNDNRDGEGARRKANKVMVEYQKVKGNQYKNQYMKAGNYYTYDYTAKHDKDLEYWDMKPMIISLGQRKTKSGDILEMGLSLHYLPITIRTIVIAEIFNMFRSIYKHNVFEKGKKPIPVSYDKVKKRLGGDSPSGDWVRFGMGFAVKSYIPKNKRNVVEVDLENMSWAAYYNPLKYKRASRLMLERDWANFIKNEVKRLK